jgi:ADP-ribosylarginine hydrolase
MAGRAPGRTTGKSIMILSENGENWNKIPYNDRACGCGASMRSACIGLAYYNDIDKLVALGIESGRITHHNPCAYLASMMSSYFTALAVKGVDPNAWIAYFL